MKKLAFVLGAALIAFFGYRLFFSSPEPKNAHPAGENIICFGDSLTAGTGADPEKDYPSQLGQMIGRVPINAGVPGDTTASALTRLDADVLSQSPRIVLITLGGNDLKNKVQREVFSRNLKTIIELIQEQGALVIVGGIDIPFWGRGFGDAYEQICRETGAILIPNIFKGILGKTKLMSDPIHPNNAGYTIMAKHFYQAIEPYL
jgi:lysophospholipase L1-like esterase